jgi:hypothetical protein
LDTSLGGRFAAGGDVSGAEEATHYPRQPENSPWSHDPVPPEEPLGFSVQDVEPCGTPVEIAASIGGDAAQGSAPPSAEGGARGLADARSGSRVEHSEAHPNLLQRRK